MSKPFYLKYRTGEKALTKEQAEKLLTAIDNLPHLALFKLALSTGLRRGDIVRVRTADIDLDKGEIKFYEKKKRRVKTVYPNPSTMQTIRMWIKQKDLRNPYLFEGRSEKVRDKGHLSSRHAYDLFQKYLRAADIPDKRPFHSLRATCVKLCQAKGWKPEQTAKHIGDTIEVIQAHYATPSDEEMRDVSNEKPLF